LLGDPLAERNGHPPDSPHHVGGNRGVEHVAQIAERLPERQHVV
jgi:hypothetical protein